MKIKVQKLSLKLLLFGVLALFTQNVYSQMDSLFWFAPPEISSSLGDQPIYFRFFSYDQPATIKISQPANTSFSPITLNIPANDFASLDLTPYLPNVESPAADMVANNGFKITSTAKISAYYELNAPNNKGLFSLKGQKALGTNFYTPFQNDWTTGSTTPSSFSSIDIIATKNNTTVLITPKTKIVGHNKNATFSITLNAGQTYSLRDVTNTNPTDLSGSIVASNKPIALTLYSGALTNSSCQSTIGDQITNTDFIGTDYIVQKGTTSNDKIYIMAVKNGTNFTITNSSTTSSLINWGETFAYDLNTNTTTYIHSNQPIYVWHVKNFGCNLSGTQLPPLFCAGNYSTAFNRSNSDSLGIMLYTHTGFEGDFKLNGNPGLIPASSFNIVPGTGGDYKATTIYFSTSQIPLNSFNKITNSEGLFGMAITSGGSSNGSTYAYLTNFASNPFINAGVNATICANSTFPLNGQVGGGSITGKWASTGLGTFQNPLNQLSNVYIPSPLDTLISPIELILTSTGVCKEMKDTVFLVVNPAPMVNANIDQTVCANNADVNLNGTITGGTSTGKWKTSGSGYFTPSPTDLNAIYIPSQNDITNGSVQLILNSTNSTLCMESSDTMVLTFTNAPNVSAWADTFKVCKNNAQVNLLGNISGNTTTGQWTTSGNGIFLPDNATLNATYQSSQNDINQGEIWLYLASTNNGKCKKVQDSVLLQYTTSPIVNPGLNITACSNAKEIPLNGTVSGPTTTGSWSGGAGSFVPNNNALNTTYHPTPAEISSGSITLTLTSTNNQGCNAESKNIEISFVPPPYANFNFTEECSNIPIIYQDFSLPGSGSIIGWNWDFGDGNQSSLQNPSHLYGNSGNYEVRLIVETNLGCTDTITQTVQSYQIPQADFSYSAACPNNIITLSFQDESTPKDSINFWFYDFGGQGTAAVQNTKKHFSSEGIYSVTHIVRTFNGCKDTIVKSITVPSMPNAAFYYNSSNKLNIGSTFSFIDTSLNASTYYWSFGDGENSSQKSPIHIYMENGNYLVTQYVRSTIGCMDSVSKIITIHTIVKEINKLIPDAISPNGDDKNDVWKLGFIATKYPTSTVQIFNQWGQIIFSSVGYENPWNGTYHGEFVPDGTYYYVINLKDGTSSDIIKGTLLVLQHGNE